MTWATVLELDRLTHQGTTLAIQIDTSRPLRRPSELSGLVDAVVQAGSADESSWIECKSELDLTQKEGRFTVARAILSFANRMPDTAANTCGGLAYVIVGAEPGKVAGTAVIDAADLDKGLIQYLGADGPAWAPTYVSTAGKDVLVIVVEAPKWGDRQLTLRREFTSTTKGSGAPKGTVFVRSQSNSRQANDAEIRMLEDRLLRGQQVHEIDGLQVAFHVSEPTRAVVAIDPTPDQIDTWIAKRRAAIIARHQAVIDAREKPRNMLMVTFLSGNRIDEGAIERHLDVCRERLLDATMAAFIESGISLVEPIVTNPGRRTLEHIELTLTIDAPHSAFEPGHPTRDWKKLPAPPPDPPEQRSIADLYGLAAGSPLPQLERWAVTRPLPVHHPNLNLDITDDSIAISVGTIRPEKTVTATNFHLFLHDPRPGDELFINWTMTSTSAEGVQRGSSTLPVFARRDVFLNPTQGVPDRSAAAGDQT